VKAVFDTNVLIAAFLTEGLCSGLMIRARKQAFSLVLCDDIIGEFEGILRKNSKSPRPMFPKSRPLFQKQPQKSFMI